MSNGKNGDAFNTQCAVKRGISVDVDGKNWLGHGKNDGTYEIDKLLLKGATMAELEANPKRNAVANHIYHLETEHGLTIVTDEDGKRRFASKQQPKQR